MLSANRAEEWQRRAVQDDAPVPTTPFLQDVVTNDIPAELPPAAAVAVAAPSPQAPSPPAPSPPQDIELTYPPLDGLRATESPASEPVVLGSLDPKSMYLLQVELTHFGAAVYKVTLSGFRESALGDMPLVIQKVIKSHDPDPASGQLRPVQRYPFALRAVTINGTRVALESVTWRHVAAGDATGGQSGAYEIDIVREEDGGAVCTLRRTYTLLQQRFDLRVDHEVINHTDMPLQVTLDTSVHTDMPQRSTTYMGDRRELAVGYFNPSYDHARRHIYTDNTKLARKKVVDAPRSGTLAPLWPNEQLQPGAELVWLASINRYFTVVAHPVVDSDAALDSLQKDFPRVGVDVHGARIGDKEDRRVLLFHVQSRPLSVAVGATARVGLGMYAGPRKRDVFESPPVSDLQFANHLIVYSLGGPCTFCTFQWLARFLLGFMDAIHFVLRDWGLAIIVLVLIVRFLLHPITKRSQIQMSKFQKQIAAMQPEIEKLKKKYGDNQQKIQQEQMKLFRERGINPMNMLGCMPMFLQMPIWIALYAMLFLAIELRHEPAFYGIFQWIGRIFTGESWGFLADLSEPDQFIKFAEGGFNLPICNVYIPYTLNLLPILMGIFFFFQTKLTATPPTNDQARQQQRMMTIMMVTIFPIMLYPAPCGLTLYIMSSTLAGMIDSLSVRRHIRRMEADGTLFETKKPKSGGFMDRVQKAWAQQQRRAGDLGRSGKS